MQSARTLRITDLSRAAAFTAGMALLLMTAVPPASAGLVPAGSMQHRIDAEGTGIIHESGSAPAVSPGDYGTPRGRYLWRSVHPSIIGSSTGISLTPGSEDVMMGHENLPTTPVEIFEADGDGIPYWSISAGKTQVAARAGTFVLASSVEGSGITLTCYRDELEAYAWSIDLPGCIPATYSNTLVVSFDGSRVFYGCFCGGKVRFLAVEAATGTVLVDQIITLDSVSLRNISASDTGRYVNLNCGVMHVVFDVDAGVERARVNMGASTNPVAISETGEWIASGFTSVKGFQWDPVQNTYVQRISRTTPSHYCGVVAISEQGFLIVGWYANTYNHNRFQRWNLVDYTLDWQFDLPYSPGSVQDLPVAVDYTPDRSLFAFGCWGDTYDVSPEILVLDAGGNEVASLHAPGSIFDVAISEDGRYVTGIGKLVHANAWGNGSDAYCMLIEDPAAVDHPASGAAGLTAWPNPFSTRTVISWSPLSATDAPWGLRIVDAQGRLVRTIAPAQAGSSAMWDGRDDSGRELPAGAYFCVPGNNPESPLRIVRIR